MGYLHRLEKSQSFSDRKIQEIQLEKLNLLLAHAVQYCPYYKDLPCSLNSLDELISLPYLEKETLRSCADDLRSRAVHKSVRSKTTGGSTGAAVTLYKNSEGMAQELAATWRGYRWAGIDIGDHQARFWGVPQTKSGARMARIIDMVTNRTRFSAFDFSDDSLADYVLRLNKLKPVYYYGYVSLIRELALHLQEGKSNLISLPKVIFTTSEVLSDSDRELIERVFKCQVFNEYGCGEVGTIAHECPEGNMHITSENMIVECLDESGLPSSEGELVVTDLVNQSMPLIRYRIKDFGAISTEPCSCGLSLPVLKEVFGREYDSLVNKDGKKFHGEFFLYSIEDLNKSGVSIEGIQFIQKSDDIIEVLYSARSEASTRIEEEITRYLENGFSSTVQCVFKPVDVIPREASGKLRVVKRDCNRA